MREGEENTRLRHVRWYPEYHRWWFLPSHRFGRRPDPLRRRQARLTLLAWALVLEIISLQLLGRSFPDSGSETAGEYDSDILRFFVGVKLTAVVGVAVVTESWTFAIGA